MADSLIAAGSRIAHYRVEGRIGSGGMGQVYRAIDLTLERPVAIKTLRPQFLGDADRVRRFVQEARSASALNHPNIVTIYEIGQARVEIDDSAITPPNVQYMAMELVEGGTLRSLIDAGTPFAQLGGVLAQAAEGLGKAHSAGIVHRDLKPDNIMITSDGYAKVVDFGLAKLAEKTGETKRGTMLGTIAYMAPEQIDGTMIGPQADVFSFGCILYECATHQHPFTSEMAMDTINRILFAEPLPIRTISTDVPQELQPILDRCLKKDPAERYASMREVSAALRAIGILPLRRSSAEAQAVSAERLQAGPQETIDEAEAWPDFVPRRRSRAGAIAGNVVKLAVAAVIAIVIWTWLTLPDVKPLRLTRPASVQGWIDYEDLPKKLQRAIVVRNDPDFYKRHAVSFASVMAADRALCVPSSITRNAARALYPAPSWNVAAPLRELFIAVSMEKELSRQRILDLYVNTAPFGDAVGIEAAAKQYLRKSADDLTDHDGMELAAKLR